MSGILAIDAGGTTTRAVIVLPSGRCLGFGLSISGNPLSSGFDTAVSSVLAATAAARSAAGAEADSLRSAVIAMAGAGSHAREQLGAKLAPLGLTGPVEIVSDVLATFRAGTVAPDGYALIAGTGAVAARIEDGRLAAVADGLGWLLGDAGSGYWIGHRVVGAVAAALDGRAPDTALTDLLLAELRLSPTGEPHDDRPVALVRLVDAIYALRPVELSRFAPLAFHAAADEVARGIRVDAAAALADTLASVRDPRIDGPVVLGGSVLNHGLLPDQKSHGIALLAGLGTAPLLPVPDGVVGAAVLALQTAGIPVDEQIFRRLSTEVSALRDADRLQTSGRG